MSDRWPNRRSARALYRPPRRALLAVGSVAVPGSVLVGGDLTTASFIGLTALAAFFMSHVERGMHPTTPHRSAGHDGDHSAAESSECHPHSTTTTTEEN
ncbi:hypothetical protein [Halococcus sp. AFM35]|uniref:hypothetical protein n=1 Tax=Halococcus sp. AFM35 TaxID=3421653 RepID=UPI003EC011FA